MVATTLAPPPQVFVHSTTITTTTTVQAHPAGAWAVGGTSLSAFADFETDLDLGLQTRNFFYYKGGEAEVGGWKVAYTPSANNLALIKNGAGAWGGLNSGSGGSFVGLQRATVSIERTLHGLVPGQLYGITFLAAYRPGYGAAVLSLSVDDAPLSGSDKIALTASFEQYAYVFNATSTNATIGFSNVGTRPGDRTAFVDAVRVTAWTTDPSTGENYWLNTVNLDWVAAEDRCQAAGASLVKLASKEESDFVMTTVASRSSPWIGCNDRAKEGVFVWTDGTSCTRYDANTPSSWCNFFSWYSGEPNNCHGGEDCVHVANVYHWNDASCSNARASICQYKRTKAAAAPTCITSTTTTTTRTTTTGTTTTACWDPNYAGTGPCTSTTTTKTTTTTLHAFELRAWTLSSDGSHYTTLDEGTGGGRYLYNVSGNSYSKYLMQGVDINWFVTDREMPSYIINGRWYDYKERIYGFSSDVDISVIGEETTPLTTMSAASDGGDQLPQPTTGDSPKPTALDSSDANDKQAAAAGNNNKTSAGKSVGIAIAVIILLAVIAFVLHRKYSNSKGLDEARHVQAEYAERENSRNTMSMESNPLARTQSNVATHETWRPAETRNRADTDRNWPAMPAAAAAVEDLTVTTAVYVNQAFEAPSAISSSNMVHLRAGRRQNKLAENPTSSRNSAEMSVYVEKNPNQPIKCDAAKTYAAPVYSEAQDGAVQLYENDFPRPAAATAAGKQQNYEDFNLIIGGVDMEAGAEAGGGEAGAREAAGVGDAGNGAHFYENHVPGYPSAVYAVPEVPTEYNSDYQIPDALAVEGVNLDYADLNNHQS
eukprot:gene21761-11094_t